MGTHQHQQSQYIAGQDDMELVMDTDVAFASTYVAHHGQGQAGQGADQPATAEVRSGLPAAPEMRLRVLSYFSTDVSRRPSWSVDMKCR